MNSQISGFKILSVINFILILWAILLFLWVPYLNLIGCVGASGDHIAGTGQCGVVAYYYGIIADSLLFLIPVLLLPFTATAWAMAALLKMRSKISTQQGQPAGMGNATKLGVVIFVLLLGLGALYYLFTFRCDGCL